MYIVYACRWKKRYDHIIKKIDGQTDRNANELQYNVCLEKGSDQLIVYRGIDRECI